MRQRTIRELMKEFHELDEKKKFESLMDAWSKAEKVLKRFNIVPYDSDDPYYVIDQALKVLPRNTELWDIAVNINGEQYTDDEFPIFAAELESDEKEIRDLAEKYFGTGVF